MSAPSHHDMNHLFGLDGTINCGTTCCLRVVHFHPRALCGAGRERARMKRLRVLLLARRYTGCPVNFAKGQLRGQATTDANGAFSLRVPGAAAADYTGGLVTLAADGGGNACTDALTGLPPPFSLGALVPAAAGGVA